MAEQTEVTKIPFETVRIPDNTKHVGEEVVVSDGVEGTRTVVTVDGHIVSDRKVAARNAVVYYGTLEKDEEAVRLPEAGENTEQPTGANIPKTVSTSEPPQEQPKNKTPEDSETDEKSFQPAETYKSNQKQGRFSKLGHHFKRRK